MNALQEAAQSPGGTFFLFLSIRGQKGAPPPRRNCAPISDYADFIYASAAQRTAQNVMRSTDICRAEKLALMRHHSVRSCARRRAANPGDAASLSSGNCTASTGDAHTITGYGPEFGQANIAASAERVQFFRG